MSLGFYGLGVVIRGISVALAASLFPIFINILNLFSGGKSIYLYRRLIVILTLILWVMYYILSNAASGKGLEGLVWWLILLFFLVGAGPRYILKSVEAVILFSVVMLFLDLGLRVREVGFGAVTSNYYLLKQSSLFGVDSNVSAIVALLTASAVLVYPEKFRRFSKATYLTLLGVLVVGTLSKAALLGYLVLLAYHFLPGRVFALFTLALLFLSPSLLLLFESGLSKLALLNEFILYISSRDSLDILFGLGVNNFVFENLALNPHVLVFQLIIYFGVVGFTLYTLFWIALALYCGSRIFYILIPYGLVSMSFTPIVLPLLCFCILLSVAYRENVKE